MLMLIDKVCFVNAFFFFFFFQAEDGIRDLVRSRGLGDVYKRQSLRRLAHFFPEEVDVDDLLRRMQNVRSHMMIIKNLSLIHI